MPTNYSYEGRWHKMDMLSISHYHTVMSKGVSTPLSITTRPKDGANVLGYLPNKVEADVRTFDRRPHQP